MDALREYLEKRGAKPVDQKRVDEYMRAMDERVIPEIVSEQKQQARLRAKMLFKPLFG